VDQVRRTTSRGFACCATIALLVTRGSSADADTDTGPSRDDTEPPSSDHHDHHHHGPTETAAGDRAGHPDRDPSLEPHVHDDSHRHAASVPEGSALGGHDHGHAGGSRYSASLGLIVADYDARLFSGDYQGLVAGAGWMRGRFAISGRLPVYRLNKNGKEVDGIGDLMLHLHASVLGRGPWSAGVMLMASAPTGNDAQGLGMGHVMVMPDVWGSWATRAFAITGSFGYARAVGGAAAHAEHGGGSMWPLVEPMNPSELTWSATGMVALDRTLGAGIRAFGAVPIGDGETRLVAGVRVIWRAGRAETSAEIQNGVVGDPFGLRGILETSVRFE